MKNLMLATVLVIFATEVMGQAADSLNTQSNKLNGDEMVIMYKNNVWHRQNGTSILVDNEVTIAGIRVKSDGTVIFPNDSTTRLKEGDFIEGNGKLFISR